MIHDDVIQKSIDGFLHISFFHAVEAALHQNATSPENIILCHQPLASLIFRWVAALLLLEDMAHIINTQTAISTMPL